MKQATGLLLALFMAVTAPGAVADVKAPDALIRETADEVLATVKHDKDMRKGDQKKLLELVEAKILPHFDFERLTRLAVGFPWRSATAEQRQALVTEFRTLLVRTYTAAFSRYQDQKVEVKSAVMNPKKSGEATVSTTIVKPGSPPIAVDYVMEKKDDGWKVFDLFIEGASLIESYRGTFEQKVHESGIDGLIKYLGDQNRAKAKEPLSKESLNKAQSK
jgi:phospholipid transport system substrate-binding protein